MQTVIPLRVPPSSAVDNTAIDTVTKLPDSSPIDTTGDDKNIAQLLKDPAFVGALQEMARWLAQKYTEKDAKARKMLLRSQLTMFANYDNKFNGLIGQDDLWYDFELGMNDYSFSVPLFKAHVDTALTFYCKTKPRFLIGTNIKSYRYTQLASMLQTVGMREYNRLMKYSVVQEEGLYALLGGKSHRKLCMEVGDDSKLHTSTQKVDTIKTGDDVKCQNCGNEFFVPINVEDTVCPNCLAENSTVPVSEVYVSKNVQVSYRTPRIQLEIKNPTQIQTDFSGKTSFVIERGFIERYKAQFKWMRDFKGIKAISPEADAQHQAQREPLVRGEDLYQMSSEGVGLGEYLKNVFDLRNEVLPEIKMTFDVENYGLIKIKGKYCYEYFPDGVFLHLVNGELVEAKPAKRNRTWQEVIAGIRPNSSQGSGLMHLANLNNLINNAINLEYSILRTSGFPVTIIREQYLQGIVPEANNAIILKNVPETLNNEQIISRLQPTSASGMLGIISEKLEGIMQFVGATFNFQSASPDMRQMMNTATGASAVQEMMTDRLGLVLQRRIEEDMTMIINIFLMLQENRSVELEAELKEEFDSATVDLFFNCDICSLITVEAEKGTDSPMLESLTVYKMQTFAQLTASLTGLREFDASSFYDLIGAIGDSLNLPVELGAGRKERHYMNVQIAKMEDLYKEAVQQGKTANMRPDEIANELFQAVKSEEAMILSVVPQVELTLFDHKAMAEVCSDWIGSKAGIESPLPVTMGVVLMFGYHQMLLDQINQQAQQQQIMMANAMQGSKGAQPNADPNADPQDIPKGAGSGGDVPSNVKRDGTTGVGRPRDVQSSNEVAHTLNTAQQPPIQQALGA